MSRHFRRSVSSVWDAVALLTVPGNVQSYDPSLFDLNIGVDYG